MRESYLLLIMTTLDHLHRLAKQGDLGCACGNHQLSFELFPDHIELYCKCCEAVGVIYAESADNVRQIEGMNVLYLEENKTWLSNSPKGGGSNMDTCMTAYQVLSLIIGSLTVLIGYSILLLNIIKLNFDITNKK